MAVARMVRLMSSSSSSSAKAVPGLMKAVPISPALQSFLGLPQCSRAQTVKTIWAYIKDHNLQSEKDKKVILCDEKLKSLLGKDEIGMLELSKLLSPHFKKQSEE